ncbi:cytochrome c assembly protein [Thermocrinis albus DSM 14484]|uniref:Cytochrome c assembly protein n=1 Tax=Thermocrinis albus (strain DSM 14484 / JCM 11386 / HI 11/12) TaxID=638303 RepID=D3SPU6_THEAH|nr:cytochrome c biogenesis protein CcsA [Thermocrinis albus]ADC89183.1 cytochrome c assembly protein [Thermocrinis albus DSM 14484]
MLDLCLGVYFLSFLAGLIQRRLGIFLLTLSVTLYLLYFIRLFYTLKSFPYANLYGVLSVAGNVTVAVFLLMSIKFRDIARFPYLMGVVGFMSTLLTYPAEQSPYRSLLYSLHVMTAVISYVSAVIGGTLAATRLLLEWELKRKKSPSLFMPLDLLRSSEKISVNITFVMLTFTMVLGSLWTRSYFGRHWIDDPKLVASLALWFYYALLSHMNLLKKISPKRFSIGLLIGTLLMMMNLFLVRHAV